MGIVSYSSLFSCTYRPSIFSFSLLFIFIVLKIAFAVLGEVAADSLSNVSFC